MLEKEKERGRKLAHLSDQEKGELIAKLMFGEDWKKARQAMFLLMETWGIAEEEKRASEVD
jgi:hypothetical protein